MKILSVFDGMSCGQLALQRAGKHVSEYYASEIDKYAMQVAMKNFPNTIQLGSITDVKAKDLPKIDLLIGGSPCQGFSFAGKQLNFNDERSKLFFEFVRLWNEIKKINPDAYFLLENVNMKKEYLRVISEYLGVFPCRINSNLVSAQNRDRWYWTNIRTKDVGLFAELWSDIPQPEDKGILLKNILQDESEISQKYYMSDKMMNYLNTRKANFNNGKINIRNNEDKASYINASSKSVDISDNFIKLDKKGNKKADQDKAGCLTGGGHSGGNHSDMDIICVAMRGRETTCLTPRRTEYGKQIRKDYESGKIKEQRKNIQQLEPREDNKTNTITSVQKDNLLSDGLMLRRLTPIECERLQTVSDNYTDCVSDTQRYKMLGNGWTVDVIAHIFSFIP